MFFYLMYLIGRRDYGLDRKTLREAIAQWFFMTSLTGRYTGNFESRVEQDLRRIGEAKSGDEFVATLNGIIDTTLTLDYWTIQLPNSLETSSAYGPSVVRLPRKLGSARCPASVFSASTGRVAGSIDPRSPISGRAPSSFPKSVPYADRDRPHGTAESDRQLRLRRMA